MYNLLLGRFLDLMLYAVIVDPKKKKKKKKIKKILCNFN